MSLYTIGCNGKLITENNVEIEGIGELNIIFKWTEESSDFAECILYFVTI